TTVSSTEPISQPACNTEAETVAAAAASVSKSVKTPIFTSAPELGLSSQLSTTSHQTKSDRKAVPSLPSFKADTRPTPYARPRSPLSPSSSDGDSNTVGDASHSKSPSVNRGEALTMFYIA